MCPSDDKHSKLSTLSQDVIAVTKKPAAATPMRTQERRSIPAAQDVFNVPAEPPPPQRPQPQPEAAYRPMPMPVVAVPAAAGSRMAWAAMAMAAIAIGLALYLAGTVTANPAGTAAGADPQIGQVREELAAATVRMQKLEQQLALAATASAKPGLAEGGNALQVSAALRDVQNRLDALANDQEKLAAQLAGIRAQAVAAGNDSKAALQRNEQLATRVTALAETTGKPGAQASTAAVSAEAQAQLKSLNQKTEKMATDIRQLYRLLENR